MNEKKIKYRRTEHSQMYRRGSDRSVAIVRFTGISTTIGLCHRIKHEASALSNDDLRFHLPPEQPGLGPAGQNGTSEDGPGLGGCGQLGRLLHLDDGSGPHEDAVLDEDGGEGRDLARVDALVPGFDPSHHQAAPVRVWLH
jgi:hypothetical protein